MLIHETRILLHMLRICRSIALLGWCDWTSRRQLVVRLLGGGSIAGVVRSNWRSKIPIKARDSSVTFLRGAVDVSVPAGRLGGW